MGGIKNLTVHRRWLKCLLLSWNGVVRVLVVQNSCYGDGSGTHLFTLFGVLIESQVSCRCRNRDIGLAALSDSMVRCLDVFCYMNLMSRVAVFCIWLSMCGSGICVRVNVWCVFPNGKRVACLPLQQYTYYVHHDDLHLAMHQQGPRQRWLNIVTRIIV